MRQSMFVLALVAVAATPLHAQTAPVAPQPDGGAGSVAMGGFAGARVLIPLGGWTRKERRVRAGLTIAPMQYRGGGGDLQSWRSRIGEGVEFGFRGGVPVPQLTLGGMPLTGASAGPAPGKEHSNLSGGNAGLIVVGVAALVGVGLLVALGDSKDDCTGGECNNN